MGRILIGETETGGSLWVDLPTLIDGRALVTGNSGAGKSRLLRRLAEQAFGKVQIVVIDPEGEFPTLREKHDFLLAGRGGEVQAEPRAAQLLARRLMELHLSAVLDLYDLRLQQRREFVRLFLEALIDLPKDLYAPVLVLLDEAHLFCPEKDEAESAGAVIDLMTRGRKRGICGVLATQRLSKLDKDAAAEAKNVFVGGIVLDVDQKRAADTLGFSGRDERIALRDILPGRFLAFGPALSLKGVTAFNAGETFTTHPKAGQRHKAQIASPTPDAIRKVAAELKDLPQQAAEEIRTLEVAKARVRELERQIRAGRQDCPTPEAYEAVCKALEKARAKTRDVPILKDSQVKRFETAVDRLRDGMTFFLKRHGELFHALGNNQQVVAIEAGILVETIKGAVAKVPAVPPVPPLVRPQARAPIPPRAGNGKAPQIAEGTVSVAQQKILDAGAFLEFLGITKPNVVQLALFAGQSAGGGYWRSNIGRLRTLGLMEGPSLTAAGRASARDLEIRSVEDLHRHVFTNVVKSPPQRAILKVLVDAYPQALEVDEVGKRANLEPAGGYWRSNLGRLRSLGLVSKRGPIQALPVLFLG